MVRCAHSLVAFTGAVEHEPRGHGNPLLTAPPSGLQSACVQVQQVIRHATEADIPAIAEVHHEGWRWAYRGLGLGQALDALAPPEREGIWRRTLAREPSGVRLWVADREGVVAGFVAAGPARAPGYPVGSAEIYALYQRQSAAGSGVARALIVHALDDLAARGFHQVFLWVLATNLAARRFYERGGWQTDGTVDDGEHGGEEVQQALYWRPLGPPLG